MEWKLELNLSTKTNLTRGSEFLMDWISWSQTWSTKSTTPTSRRPLRRSRKNLRWKRMYLLLQADQRLKQDHGDLRLLAHLHELYLFVKEDGPILNQELNPILRMCAWCRCTRGRFERTHGGVFFNPHTVFFHVFFSVPQHTQTHTNTHHDHQQHHNHNHNDTHTHTTPHHTTQHNTTQHNTTQHTTPHRDRDTERQRQTETERDREKRDRERERERDRERETEKERPDKKAREETRWRRERRSKTREERREKEEGRWKRKWREIEMKRDERKDAFCQKMFEGPQTRQIN